MEHSVDLNELRHVVGKYVDQYNLVVAAGPMAAATVLKTFAGRNKALSWAVAGGAVWFAVQEVSNPVLKLIEDQFAYLQSLLGSVR